MANVPRGVFMLILSSIQRVKKIKVFELIKLILMMRKPISLGEASKSGEYDIGVREWINA